MDSGGNLGNKIGRGEIAVVFRSMTGRYWRYVCAAVGFLITSGLFYAGYEQLDYTDHQPYADYEYQPARDRTVAPLSEQPKVAAKPYRPDCQNPQSRDDADLCAQWASVQATGEGNRLSRIGILITGLEFGALLLSLFFTGWAAFAASKAAKIAEESTKDTDRSLIIAERNADAAARSAAITEQALVITERARITFDGHGIPVQFFDRVTDKVQGYSFPVGWRNRGRTDGLNCVMAYQFRYKEKDIPTSDEMGFHHIETLGDATGETGKFTFGAGTGKVTSERFCLPIDRIMEIFNRKTRLFLWSGVEYDDIFEERYLGSHRHYSYICTEILVRNDPTIRNRDTRELFFFTNVDLYRLDPKQYPA